MRSSSNELKLGKRGVYMITGEGKLRSFQLIGWEEIFKTLDAPPNLKADRGRSRLRQTRRLQPAPL